MVVMSLMLVVVVMMGGSSLRNRHQICFRTRKRIRLLQTCYGPKQSHGQHPKKISHKHCLRHMLTLY
jgi:hypothetical protein